MLGGISLNEQGGFGSSVDPCNVRPRTPSERLRKRTDSPWARVEGGDKRVCLLMSMDLHTDE